MGKREEEDTKPERLLIEVDGEDTWVEAYSLSQAAKKIGRTYQSLLDVLARRRKEGRAPTLYKPEIGRGQYILDEDLKDLMRARPIAEEEEK